MSIMFPNNFTLFNRLIVKRTYPLFISGMKITSLSSLGSLTPYGFSAFTRNLYSDPSINSDNVALVCLLVIAFNHTSQPTYEIIFKMNESPIKAKLYLYKNNSNIILYHQPYSTRQCMCQFCNHRRLPVLSTTVLPISLRSSWLSLFQVLRVDLKRKFISR